MSKVIDKRLLSNGQTRYRFKLSDNALKVVKEAFDLTSSIHPNTAFEKLCQNFMSGNLSANKPKNCIGRNRLLIRVYPDQEAFISLAFNEALKIADISEAALVMISENFINEFPHHSCAYV